MQKVELAYYIADDGTNFLDEETCKAYEEQERKIREEWKAFLSTISVEAPENNRWTKKLKNELVKKG